MFAIFKGLFYLKDRFAERGDTETEFPTYGFTPQMASMAIASPVPSQELGTSYDSPTWV